MKYCPAGSLRSYLNIPQVRVQSVAQVALKTTMPWVKNFWDHVEATHSSVSPDTDAIKFYALNHLVGSIKSKFDMDEVLPLWAQEVMVAYTTELAVQGQRMYAYMLLIITRESRHLKSFSPVWYQKLPAVFKTFHGSIKGKGSLDVAKTLCSNPPEMNLGDYTAALVKVFGGSFSSGYGGPSWAKIAKSLHDMVVGTTSLELMIDVAYALAHNNGPMFNKGMLYEGYTQTFIKILDVQRSGQIPEAVKNGEFPNVLVPSDLKALILKCESEGGLSFGSYVDWEKVESLGAVHKYPNEKKKYLKDHPVSPKPILLYGKPALLIGEFTVFPGVAVQQVKRIAV